MSGGILSCTVRTSTLVQTVQSENTAADHGRYEQGTNCPAALNDDIMTAKFTIKIISLHSTMLNTLLKMQAESLPAGDSIYL
jgi:hypothetical protein